MKHNKIILNLRVLFSHSDCRVVRDPQTLKSKGYGFVSFVKKAVSINVGEAKKKKKSKNKNSP